MPSPWATCTDCMLLPHAMQPQPPIPKPVPKPEPKKRAPRAKKPAKAVAPKSAKPKEEDEPPRPTTKLPKSGVDTLPTLLGDKDLAYEIPDGSLRFHIQGADSTWLSISSMPRELRDGGYVYLQSDRNLLARCRVKGIGFRERRWTHAEPGVTSDAGPGATIELHEGDWELMSIDLGAEGEAEIRGYRYLVSGPDGSIRPALGDEGNTGQ